MSTLKLDTRWSLNDLLPGGEGELESLMTQIEACVQVIESFRPRLTPELTTGKFQELMHAREELRQLTSRLGGYAYLRYAENTQAEASLSLKDRVDQLLTGVDNRTMFFSLWFKELPEKSADRFIEQADDLKYHLASIRRFKPYTLSEAEEKIINLKDNGPLALMKLERSSPTDSARLEVERRLKINLRWTGELLPHFRMETATTGSCTGAGKTRLPGRSIFAGEDWVKDRPRGIQARCRAEFCQRHPRLGGDAADVCCGNANLFQRYFILKAKMPDGAVKTL
jgi:oligoendopeptidase F